MGLLDKLGGAVREAGRSQLTNAILKSGGIHNGVSYPEYEYDANGHIKGVNSKYEQQAMNLFSGTSLEKGTDDSYNMLGLSTGSSKYNSSITTNTYPKKYSAAANDNEEINTVSGFQSWANDDENKKAIETYNAEVNKLSEKINELNTALNSELTALDNEYLSSLNTATGAQGTQGTNAVDEKKREEYNKKRNEILQKYNKDLEALQNTNISDPYKDVSSVHGLLFKDTSESRTGNNSDFYIDTDKEKFSDTYTLKLPDWTYADFINERAIWQKGLSSILDEPGWFYFKIFFDFNTNHGLFGGLLNERKFTFSINSAAKYLYSVRKYHKHVKAKDRINALHKFSSILSYICNNAPWFFKSVKNLNAAASVITKEFSKERSIEIGVSQDAIDMRLSTLMSLYNFACFDSFYGKEVIPENLRKFNMSIIVFQTPLRYLHTSFTSKKNTQFLNKTVSAAISDVKGLLGLDKETPPMVKYKSMNITNGDSANFGDLMSMKIYSFYGCEFDTESFNTIIPSDMSNETPFQLGNSSIKITYRFSTEHTMNEFYGMMWGNDGFYFNQYNNFQLSNGNFNGYVNKNEEYVSKQENRYKALKDNLDNLTQGGTVLGLINTPNTYKQIIDATEALMNGVYDSGGFLNDLKTNFLLGLTQSSYSVKAPQGNLYGDVGIGSAYFKDKVDQLKFSNHERTMPPYYFDPNTGTRVDIVAKRGILTGYASNANDITGLLNGSRSFNIGGWFGNNINGGALSLNNAGDWLMTTTQNAGNFITGIVGDTLGLNGDYPKNTKKPEKPNLYTFKDGKNPYEIDNKRWGDMGKSHILVDANLPSYDGDKVIVGNPAHERTEAPYNYSKNNNKNNSNENDFKSAGEPGKSKLMVDNPNTWTYTQKPNKAEGTQQDYTYDMDRQQKAINDNLKENGFKLVGVAGKNELMVDDPNTWTYTEAPYNYEPKNSVDYENSKAGGKDKLQVLTDKIGNPVNERTEAPFKYNSNNAIDYENSKAGDVGKTQVLTDKIGNDEHEVTEAPFKYESKEAVKYENSKAGDTGKTQVLTDKIGNDEHEYTEAPYDYDEKNAVEYENSKAGGPGKSQVLRDGVGNSEHEYTEAPFSYDEKNAIDYENGKAGGEGKTQILTDGIGNDKHEYTEPPYDYNPLSITNGLGNAHDYTEPPYDYDEMNAVNYENSKAGGEGKTQVLTDGIGNNEHEYTEAPYDYDPLANKSEFTSNNEFTEAPYDYDPLSNKSEFNSNHEFTEAPYDYDEMNAVNYENSKAGGEGKTQVLTDGIGNDEHEYTEAPYDYDPLANKLEFNSNHEFTEAPYDYDNSSKGEEVDSEHNFTEAPYKYEPSKNTAISKHNYTEAPYDYDEMNAINYENSKAGGIGKTQVLVDDIGNDEHEYTEAPFAYDGKNAIDYEMNKTNNRYKEFKSKEMVDGIGNPLHEFTEAPYDYDPLANKTEASSDHNFTEEPFKYESIEAVNYENSKAGGERKTQVLVDKIGNPEHEYTEPPYHYDASNDKKQFNSENIFTEEPFAYDSMNAIEYENSKAGEMNKTQVLVDGIGNDEHEYTEEPFAYDSINAIDYENSKAGEEGKTQVLVDKIGNPEHEYTEPPYKYDPATAVEYENSKAGEMNKLQAMVDEIGNPIHQITESPFKYAGKESENYEHGKAGGEYKTEAILNDFRAPVHYYTEGPYKGSGLHNYNLSKYLKTQNTNRNEN